MIKNFCKYGFAVMFALLLPLSNCWAEEVTFTIDSVANGYVKITPSDNEATYCVVSSMESTIMMRTMVGQVPVGYEEEYMALDKYGKFFFLGTKPVIQEDCVFSGEATVNITDLDHTSDVYGMTKEGAYVVLVAAVDTFRVGGNLWANRLSAIQKLSCTYDPAALPPFVAEVSLSATSFTVAPADAEQDYAVVMEAAESYNAGVAALGNSYAAMRIKNDALEVYSGTQTLNYADVCPEELEEGDYVLLIAAAEVVGEGQELSLNVLSEVLVTDLTYPYVPTALENIEAAKAVKVVNNGKLFILRDGVRYDALGVKE